MNSAVGHSSNRSAIVALCAGLAIMAGAALFLSRMQGFQRLGKPGVKVVPRAVLDEAGSVVATNAVYLPDDLAGYKAEHLPITRVELDWLPRDTTYGRTDYETPDGGHVLMSAVLMGADRTSIHKPEYCLVGQGFRIEEQSVTTIRIQDRVPYDLPVMKMVTVRETKLPDGSVHRTRALYVYWFVADGQLSADHNQRMISMARDLLTTGVLQRWAYISCLAEGDPGTDDLLFARVAKLVSEAVPRFQLTAGKGVRLAGKP